MIGSFYRLWLACAVVALGGVVHAFWLAPEAWEGVQAVQRQTGSVGIWDYLRGAMVLLPGIGLVVMWERSQKRKAEMAPVDYSERADQAEYRDRRLAA
jgi:hypothetical protein